LYVRSESLYWYLVREQNAHKKRRHGPEPNPESGRQKLFALRQQDF
jgi:hypothetical protein